MEFDKENREHQVVGRKPGELESKAPRTPFAEVNRQTIQDSGTKQSYFTPLQSKTKEASLRKQLIEKRHLGKCVAEGPSTHASGGGNIEEHALSCSLPASPTLKCPVGEAVSELHPVVSHSCPDMLTSSPSLPPVSETVPGKLDISQELSDLPDLSHDNSSVASPDLSIECEDVTQSDRDISCQTDSDVEEPFIIREYFADVNGLHEWEGTSDSEYPVSGVANSSLLSDENSSSENQCHFAHSPGEAAVSSSNSLQTSGLAEDTEIQSDSTHIVHDILDELLSTVEKLMSKVPSPNEKLNEKYITANANSANLTQSTQPHTYIAEYAKFVELYTQDNSPAFASGTSSLTDVTPLSQNSAQETDGDPVSLSGGHMVVLDSLSSFVSESDDSFLSSSTVQRQLTFEDMDLGSPAVQLDESTGFVKSSDSAFDLRKGSLDARDDGEYSAENEALNLSLADQRVEFFALPSSSALLRHAPKIVDSRSATSQTEELQIQNKSFPSDAELTAGSCAGKGTHDIALSPVAVLVRDVQTMTVGAETATASLSPIMMRTCEKSVVTEASETSEVGTTTTSVDTNSIALSPIPVSLREKEMNTDITETSDADTMTRVPTSDVASSPIAVPVKEINTMTVNAETMETGMTTEEVLCLDHSVLATAVMDHKTTMTDSTGCRNISTTMTPFKTLAKQGRRLTSNDIRKQHPRALANQLETLSVSNSRLENELRSAEQERKQLQGALKEAKKSTSSKQAEIAAAEKKKEEEWKEKERQLENERSHLEQQSLQEQSRIAALERELSTLRADIETEAQKQVEELSRLQEKCQALEESQTQTSQQYEQEIQELKSSQETNSYRHQFERAQQMVREREAELEEIRGLFSDLQKTAHKQEQVSSAYQEVHNKILSLAKENKSLKDTLARRASVSKEEVEKQQTEMGHLLKHNATLLEEGNNLRQTLTINSNNLAELEKLYSVSSSDLLAATGKVVELNTELFGARKALQDIFLAKEALTRRTSELEDKLSTVQEDYASLTAALEHTQAKLHQQSAAHETLQLLSQKMKKVYEDKLENMELGVENLQRTLDNRDLDIDNLEKDLYECRNIIVEQRYKINSLESDLLEARSVASQKKAEEEDIEFFKESNAFLEAERSLYVQSLRDLEEKLKVTALDSFQHQQKAEEAKKFVAELQGEKLKLLSELSDVQNQFLRTSHALSAAKEEHEIAESVAMAAANDLLQHMQLMLAGLKKKIGLQEVPELDTVAAKPQPQLSVSKPVKSKRHSRKSFVSKILGAATTSDAEQGTEQEEEDALETAETGSYLGPEISKTGSGVFAAAEFFSPVKARDVSRRAREGHVPRSERSFAGPCVSESESVTAEPHLTGRSDSSVLELDSASSRRIPNFSPRQSVASSMTCSSALKLRLSQLSAFTPVHTSSFSAPRLPPHSLLHPPGSEPPASAFAKIRSIPKTKRRSEQPVMQRLPVRKGGEQRVYEEESRLVTSISSLKEVFSGIVRLAGILDRATQLSLQDLREENDMLRERTEILEERMERSSAQLNISRQEMVAKDTTIAHLQQQSRGMTDHMMALTDHKFEVQRLNGEMKRLESQLEKERGEKSILSAELDTLLLRLETSASSTEGGVAQARCMRDIISLKKKNQQLGAKVEEQRDHYEELGSKAARRMRVLDDNWKKAEDEVYRLDDLVENIKQVAERQSRSSSPGSSLHRILQLIEGQGRSPPL